MAAVKYDISGALKMQDRKMRDQETGVENAGPENAGPRRIWKMKDHDVSEVKRGCKMSGHQERLLKGSQRLKTV